MVTGLNAAVGIAFALIERGRSTQGQYLEVALYDAGLSLLHPHAANHLMDGRIPGRSGNAHPNITPYDTFATATEKFFSPWATTSSSPFCASSSGPRICPAMSALRPTASARRTAQRSRSAWRRHSRFECKPLADRLVRQGVPCAPIQDVASALADPHTHHRGMVVEIGSYRGVASPIKLSRTPASYRLPPPDRSV